MNCNIKSVLEEYFSSVYSVISEKYDIPVSDLEGIFNSLFNSNEKKTDACVYVFERSGKNNKKGDVCGVNIKGEGEFCSKHKPKEKKEQVPVKKQTKEKKESRTCPHVFDRNGKNNKKGDVCGVNIKGDGEFCSKHKKEKKEKTEEEKPKKSKLPKPQVPSKKKKKEEEIIKDEVIEKEIKEAKPKVILKKHKNLGIFYHAETRFVFESPMDRIIIGKLTDEDLIDQLTKEDEKLIEKYKFIVA
jgi:hypothetical protein